MYEIVRVIDGQQYVSAYYSDGTIKRFNSRNIPKEVFDFLTVARTKQTVVTGNGVTNIYYR